MIAWLTVPYKETPGFLVLLGNKVSVHVGRDERTHEVRLGTLAGCSQKLAELRPEDYLRDWRVLKDLEQYVTCFEERSQSEDSLGIARS